MSNPYYNTTGNPGTASSGLSALMRAEFAAIANAFGLLPMISGNANKVVTVNSGATGLTVSAATLTTAGDLTVPGDFIVDGNTILTGTLALGGSISSPSSISAATTVSAGTGYYVSATLVIGARQTGWTAGNGGTPNKGAIDYSTATLTQLANRVMALEQAIFAGIGPHGLIGA